MSLMNILIHKYYNTIETRSSALRLCWPGMFRLSFWLLFSWQIEVQPNPVTTSWHLLITLF